MRSWWTQDEGPSGLLWRDGEREYGGQQLKKARPAAWAAQEQSSFAPVGRRRCVAVGCVKYVCWRVAVVCVVRAVVGGGDDGGGGDGGGGDGDGGGGDGGGGDGGG